jgi:thiol:disulfide interchange protein DsbD
MRTLLLSLLLTFGTGVLAATNILGKKAEPDFLPVDQAFEIQPLVWKDDGMLEVSWRIAKDYYLYRDRLKFAAAKPASLKLGKPVLPAATPHEDEHFGAMQVYRDKLVVLLPFSKDAKGPVSLTVVYQGCADAGLCYPPQTRTLEAGR